MILVGHTCRVCSDAIDHVGSVGPTSLERSLVAHVAPDLLPKLGWDNVRVDGSHGWAITAHEDPSVQANTTPFGHLPDLAKISGQLKAALGG